MHANRLISIVPMSRRILWLCTVVIGAFYLLIAAKKPVALLYAGASDKTVFIDLAGSMWCWLSPRAFCRSLRRGACGPGESRFWMTDEIWR
jgi:hypothetical protein